jgi:pimeloyl-ACP methyl ester carboxylesterase
LNAYPQFMTRVDGQDVHFVHVRSSSPSALPLILTHGWPGSVVEFQQVIPLLSPHFHLVIPSIPGFGFSGPTSSTGWSLMRVARAWAALMESLGYTRYGAQGGDFGSGISRLLASVAPSSVVGVHVNYLPSMGTPRSPLSASDQERLEKTRRLAANRHPHQVMFASTPQTLAYAMNDSPAGVLAFLAEKFTVWADPSTPISDEAILTDVMVYWPDRPPRPWGVAPPWPSGFPTARAARWGVVSRAGSGVQGAHSLGWRAGVWGGGPLWAFGFPTAPVGSLRCGELRRGAAPTVGSRGAGIICSHERLAADRQLDRRG